MTDTRSDYARTDQADNALIPYDMIRQQLGISHVTLWRKLKAAGVESVPYNGGKAVRFGDLQKILPGRSE